MRLQKADSFALQVDIQGKLANLIADHHRLYQQTALFIKGLTALNVEILINEQVPEKLGPTLPSLMELLPDHVTYPKHTFSIWDEPATREVIEKLNKKTAILYGIETHVCVAQTALDMMEAGYRVVVVSDVVGSRFVSDKDTALLRLQAAGAVVTSMESLLFELCRDAKAPEFRAVSKVAVSRIF